VPTQTTNLNVATRRYWLQLKYSENEPVLRQFKCVSKPSRKVPVNVQQLLDLRAGKGTGLVKPLVPGEVLILSTPRGVFDLNEAIENNVGGHVLARVV
jgi:small subunit ribosomal protein S8